MLTPRFLGSAMFIRVVTLALWATVGGAAMAQAQSVADVSGPANLPPAGFKGQQFVDNRGCVFLKAGYGGQTNWVPRVGRNRKALCGYPPTFGQRPVIEMADAADMAPAPKAAPQPAAKPAPVVVVKPAAPKAPAPAAKAPVVVVATPAAPAPYADRPPAGTYERVASSGVPQGKIGCYTSAPVAERVRLRNGGTAVVCTRGDGTMTGWRPPVYPDGSGVGASLTYPQVAVTRGGNSPAASGMGDYAAAAPPPAEKVPAPPAGYVLAWKDDRLNPNRGKGTAEGWAQQDQVWTRETPARLVSDQPKKRKKVAVVASNGRDNGTGGAFATTTSTKGSATAPVAKPAAKGGRIYVQIGTFGVPANAEGAAGRLKAAGLPVARSKITSKGKAMQIVLAGPFGSAADAQAALGMVRRAGFGDAFIR